MQRNRRLRIAVDCRIESSQEGTGTALLALAKAFSESKAADQEYTFIVNEGLQGWLAPYIYGPCRLVGIPSAKLSTAKAALRWIAPLRFIWHKLRGGLARVPVSDGYV